MSLVVVVGAGVGGLAAAARLAALGHRVTVCEQAPVVGGKLGVRWAQTAAGEFVFDTGPSLLTLPQVFADLFAETGAPLDSLLELVPLDPVSRCCFGDGSHLDVRSDPAAMRAGIAATFGTRAGEDWERLWQRAQRIWLATHIPFLESAVDDWRTLARLAVRVPDFAAVAPWQTLHGLGERYLHDPRLRQLFDRYATYTGSDPSLAPAALAAVPYAELAFGGWYVRGGLHRIAEALLRRCAELGVVVRTDADVQRIDLAGTRVCGVTLADGGSLPADVVVANADAAQLYTSLVRLPAAAARIRRASPSLSGFALLLGVRGATPDLAHHTVLFPADYAAEFAAVFGDPAGPVPDPTLYVCAPKDPLVQPPGCETWFVLVNAPRHGTGPGAIDWTVPGRAEAYAAHLLDRLAARGLDVRQRLVHCEWRTPYDLERETRAAGGAIYGTASHGPRSAFLRPANRSPVPGLFLVGGSTHPGGGLPLVALSAKIVAGLIGPA